MVRHLEHPQREVAPPSIRCNCAVLREAACYVTQLYDLHLAAAGLRSTQFSILNRLKELGPTTINALAHAMVMDRTTVGRNILPLQRRPLIVVKRGENDARRKELHVTLLKELNAQIVERAGISPDDLPIQLSEAPGENFSFGQGLAQRACVSAGTVADGDVPVTTASVNGEEHD
jgi:DNA-binding MarR family transcriptional regulator